MMCLYNCLKYLIGIGIMLKQWAPDWSWKEWAFFIRPSLAVDLPRRVRYLKDEMLRIASSSDILLYYTASIVPLLSVLELRLALLTSPGCWSATREHEDMRMEVYKRDAILLVHDVHQVLNCSSNSQHSFALVYTYKTSDNGIS
jgi:hypothetical protein